MAFNGAGRINRMYWIVGFSVSSLRVEGMKLRKANPLSAEKPKTLKG
jgi:hypothetical protein